MITHSPGTKGLNQVTESGDCHIRWFGIHTCDTLGAFLYEVMVLDPGFIINSQNMTDMLMTCCINIVSTTRLLLRSSTAWHGPKSVYGHKVEEVIARTLLA